MERIITSKRFLPLFVTQFLGAFNDNLFKNAMVILITYRLAADNPEQAAMLVNIAFGLFVLPILMFSYLSGQMADKIDRARIARWVKISEIGLALLGGFGLWIGNLPLLLTTLFGFGAHSTFFGPVKYAILPQHLREDELVTGNGYIEAGTFLAILAGTIAGGVLILTGYGAHAIAMLLVSCAALGYVASRSIPSAPAPVPGMKWVLNPLAGTMELIRHSRSRRHEFLCILGISWFWFVGALVLAQFSPFAKDVLHADEGVVTLFLVVFSVGIACGSMLCARVIKGYVRATPVPFGALGMSFFAADLYRASLLAVASEQGALLDVMGFLGQSFGRHVIFDLLGLAVCGGLYIVPLYALLQIRADSTHGARAIASNNLMNALFMVAAAVFAMGCAKIGISIPRLFFITAILNLGVAVYVCRLLPLSLVAGLLKLLYRVEVHGIENWAKAGNRVVIVGNHTAFLDAVIFAAFMPERVGFAVNTFIAQKWWIKFFLNFADTYTLDPSNPMAAKTLIDEIKKDKKVVIFPEGRLTTTGSLMKIYEGPGMIADRSGAMILPVRIDGAQYSPLSRLKGKVRIRRFPKITLTFLPPRKFDLPADLFGRRRRQLASRQLYDLMSQMIFDSSPKNKTIMQSFVEAMRVHGCKHIIVEDPKRLPLSYRAFAAKTFGLARLIQKATQPDETHIGLMLPNMTATAVSFFALQALGRVAAMINFTSGPGAVLNACKIAQIRTVLTSQAFIDAAKLGGVVVALEQAGVAVICLESFADKMGIGTKLYALAASLCPEWALSRLSQAKPEDVAAVLFTSGSEGAPKGVALSHQNILANRYQLASRVDFGPQDTVFNCLPMFHAFGLTAATVLPLLSGIKVFFYPSPLHYRIVPELVYDTNATILFGTDTFLSGYARFAHPYDLYTVRYVFAGAEKLKDETRRLWFERFGVRIFEGYGATETAPVISVNTAMHYKTGSVGRVMPGVETRLEPVPGVDRGKRLFVRGPNVMLGYFKGDAPGVLQALDDSWYDTGDVVDIDDEGYVFILGRVKRFAKIGGEMISLTAVENVLAVQWPQGIHAVVSVPDEKKGEALILVTDNLAIDVASLLPVFRGKGFGELTVPRRIVHVEKMPLLGTGKTDYVSLSALVSGREAS